MIAMVPERPVLVGLECIRLGLARSQRTFSDAVRAVYIIGVPWRKSALVDAGTIVLHDLVDYLDLV